MRGLFVSKEHRTQVILCTHRAYQLAAYIFIAFTGLQIFFFVNMLSQKKREAGIRQNMESAVTERTRILFKSEQLREVLEKVQAAQSWNPLAIRKFGVTEILSYLEESVSAGICLTEIIIQNKSQNHLEPDRFEVEIRGYGKNREPELWVRSLEEKFSSWKILKVGKSTTPDGSEGLASFSFLLQQPTYP